jgi:hypothetical protein
VFVAAMFTVASALVLAAPPAPRLFSTARSCAPCHDGLVTPDGEDVSIGIDWGASMMAHSAKDPYWMAAVRREVLDHPSVDPKEIEDECSICHMPVTTFLARQQGRKGELFAHALGRGDPLAADGVSCTGCHQIQAENLGQPESFTGGFSIDTRRPFEQRQIFGPFDVGRGAVSIMRSASGFEPHAAEHISSSELCATCHTLYTHARGPDGQVVGRFPEQVPYLEWRHSAYPGTHSCQSCHMPVVAGKMASASVAGEVREGFSRHTFVGGNFFMLRMLNRHREALGVTASTQALSRSVQQTEAFLKKETARLAVACGPLSPTRLEVTVAVENLTGHKFPTAYPSRRAWLQLRVRDARGKVLFESGALAPDGSIVGNVNDQDPARFEPHYQEIRSPEQVQIYETIMANVQDEVTTGLLAATHLLKDNRVLPRGFDKATAIEDIAVRGAAADDPDFQGGGDRVRYSVQLEGNEGPLHVEAALWYQPIAFRWAANLAPYQAPETRWFVRAYQQMSQVSALRITGAEASCR